VADTGMQQRSGFGVQHLAGYADIDEHQDTGAAAGAVAEARKTCACRRFFPSYLGRSTC
jgi:hypothetical protein